MSFQLRDDLSVAANRPVQPLQIAVHDEDQVVQLLARGQRDRAQGFGLVGFAVAQKRPDLAGRYGYDAAILQIPHEARLIDRIDRAEAHRDGGKLPEVRHQPGMRVGGKARMLAQLVAEVFQVLLIQTAFQERAGVLAGRGVTLEVDKIARLIAVPAVEEMVVADFGQSGERRVGGDVAADAADRACWRVPPWPWRSSGSGS